MNQDQLRNVWMKLEDARSRDEFPPALDRAARKLLDELTANMTMNISILGNEKKPPDDLERRVSKMIAKLNAWKPGA